MVATAKRTKHVPPNPTLNPFGKYVYVVMHALDEHGASILMIDDPICDRVRAHYIAVVECDDRELASRNSVLWLSRQEKVEALLKPVFRHVDEGYYNNEIRDALVKVCRSEHWDDLADVIEKLPDRLSLGNAESWSMSAIRLWAGEMQHWWGYLRVLRIDAARWALKKLGTPVVVDPAV